MQHSKKNKHIKEMRNASKSKVEKKQTLQGRLHLTSTSAFMDQNAREFHLTAWNRTQDALWAA